jgi:peptide/nickel transport system substrate-binding protein
MSTDHHSLKDLRPFIIFFCLFFNDLGYYTQAIELTPDPSPSQVTGQFQPHSHIKVHIPHLPYLSISHDINGALLRPAENERGWIYDVAKSHISQDDIIWDFELKQGVTFQDGSIFDADSVLENVNYFRKAPFSFSKFSKVLDRVEKLNSHKVRFILKEPYGVLLYDLIWLQFYTSEYLQKFGWNGKPTCPNLAEPGPYGLGPYILKKGYVEGDRNSGIIELKAHRDYWGEHRAHIENITIFTDYPNFRRKQDLLHGEGFLDFSPIPFSQEVETVLSPHAKLMVSPSQNNYAMHMNLINGHPALKDPDIRYIINHCIDQEILLNLSMMGEGTPSPTMVSPHFYKVQETIQTLKKRGIFEPRKDLNTVEKMRNRIRQYQKENLGNENTPLNLTVLSQKGANYLLPDLQYFFKQVHIELKILRAEKESDVFQQLFKTWNSSQSTAWDFLIWGNYDWYKHPWAAFFVYLPSYAWSTIPPNPKLVTMIDQLLRSNMESHEYPLHVGNLIEYVYQNNFMVFLPTPHNVFAVNKELVCQPGKSAYVYLRDMEVTPHHWSLKNRQNNEANTSHHARPLDLSQTKLNSNSSDSLSLRRSPYLPLRMKENSSPAQTQTP